MGKIQTTNLRVEREVYAEFGKLPGNITDNLSGAMYLFMQLDGTTREQLIAEAKRADPQGNRVERSPRFWEDVSFEVSGRLLQWRQQQADREDKRRDK